MVPNIISPGRNCGLWTANFFALGIHLSGGIGLVSESEKIRFFEETIAIFDVPLSIWGLARFFFRQLASGVNVPFWQKAPFSAAHFVKKNGKKC